MFEKHRIIWPLKTRPASVRICTCTATSHHACHPFQDFPICLGNAFVATVVLAEWVCWNSRLALSLGATLESISNRTTTCRTYQVLHCLHFLQGGRRIKVAAFGFECVLGPLCHHTLPGPYISGVSEATHKASHGPLKGPCQLKEKGPKQRRGGCWEELQRIVFPWKRAHWFALLANKWFFLQKMKQKKLS